MPQTTLNGTTTKDQEWEQKKGYAPLIVLTALLLLLGLASYAGLQIRGSTVAGGTTHGSATIASMIHYDPVTITNKTPYDVLPDKYNYDDDTAGVVSYVMYGTLCGRTHIHESIAPRDTWTDPDTQGLCLVREITVVLNLANRGPKMPKSSLRCSYDAPSFGTTHWGFFIRFTLVKGRIHRCCVQSSHQTQVCEAWNDDERPDEEN